MDKSRENNNDVDSKVKEVTQKIEDIKSEIEEIDSFYKEYLDSSVANRKSKADEIIDSYEEIVDRKDEVQSLIDKIKSFKIEIIGKSDEDYSDSLKKDFEVLKADLKYTFNNAEEQYAELFKKIESLLPGATAAGLAKSYADQKRSYRGKIWIWSGVFTITMIGMVFYAIYQFDPEGNLTVLGVVKNILLRAPFFIPTIWLALYASKRQSQYNRLEQEYAYKESLAKSYEGYSREIEKLSDEKEKTIVSANLMKAMVNAAAENPSKTLDQPSHNDKPPFGGLFNRGKTSNSKTGTV